MRLWLLVVPACLMLLSVSAGSMAAGYGAYTQAPKYTTEAPKCTTKHKAYTKVPVYTTHHHGEYTTRPAYPRSTPEHDEYTTRAKCNKFDGYGNCQDNVDYSEMGTSDSGAAAAGLSVGAIVGIGVGAVVGGAVIYKRKRDAASSGPAERVQTTSTVQPKSSSPSIALHF